ncbi:TOBE domain-containing protein [Vibrio sp. SCSIO 43135]|uniref:TOBE domain-containing protein n=1 Tax=Vibrio sp. SCSIO 43135 TaxID=2819096 RepID=UPI00207606BA|nr:TOBE domain-containing protein [Vibrio sp. SCSIO 43135]USD43097.1 TOBE domain-containing protein [Vibrio sp. SCSIO 43135]
MDLQALLTLNLDNRLFANPRRIALLEQIVQTGSISQGAKLSGMSYKAAWDAVNDMNTAFNQPVVLREKGGKGGGGAQVTQFGQRLLKVYFITSQVQEMALTALLDDSIEMNSLLDLMAHFSLHTSARNQLTGQIESITLGGINDHVSVRLADNQIVKVAVTHTSVKKLALEAGSSVLLLFKAPAVSISPVKLETCSHNCLNAELVAMTKQGSDIELELQLSSQDKIYSVMAGENLAELEMQIGQTYFACFDSAQTIVAKMSQ